MPEIIMAFASLTFLIIYALKTRRMAESMVLATLLAIIAQFLLYVPQKITTVKQFFEHFFNGAKGMTSLAIVVCFGFMLSEANRELGLFDILINGIGGTVPADAGAAAGVPAGGRHGVRRGGLPAVRRRRVLTEYKRERASGRMSAPVLHGFLTRLRAGFLVYYH